jgi:hypothetical protein
VNQVSVLSSKLKSATGALPLVGIELECGNCGAVDYINVVTEEEARDCAMWCPVCEDTQDPAPAVERFRELVA